MLCENRVECIQIFSCGRISNKNKPPHGSYTGGGNINAVLNA